MKTPHQAGKKEPKTNILLISILLFFVVFLNCSNVAAPMPPYPVFIYTNSTYGELVAGTVCNITNLNTAEYYNKTGAEGIMMQFNLGEITEFPSLYSDGDVFTVTCTLNDVALSGTYTVDIGEGMQYINWTLQEFPIIQITGAALNTNNSISFNFSITSSTINNISIERSYITADNFIEVTDLSNESINYTSLVNVNTSYYRVCVTNAYNLTACSDNFAQFLNLSLEVPGASDWTLNSLITNKTRTIKGLCDALNTSSSIGLSRVGNTQTFIYCPWKDYFNDVIINYPEAVWINVNAPLEYIEAGLTQPETNINLNAGLTTVSYINPIENQTQADFCSERVSGGGTVSLYKFDPDTGTEYIYVCGMDIPNFNFSTFNQIGNTILSTESMSLNLSY